MPEENLYNEKRLLSGIAERNEKAFSILYNRHYAHIYYFARRIVGDEVAKDVTIEVFAKLWKSETVFESNKHLISYLRKLARNDCIDKLRRMKAETKKQRDLLSLSDMAYEEVYFKDLLEAHLHTKIAREIDKLPGHLKAIFKLAFYEGLKNNEIAKRLSIKDATVRVGKAEAIKKLRLTVKYSDLLILMIVTFPGKNIF